MLRDRRGSILVPFAVSASVALLAIGYGVDISARVSLRAQLQSWADAAAVAGALAVDPIDQSARGATRDAALGRATTAVGRVMTANTVGRAGVAWTVDLTGNEPPFGVEVTVTGAPQPLMPDPFGLGEAPVEAKAAGLTAEAGPICVLALGSGPDIGIEVNNAHALSAPGCGFHSNAQTDQAIHFMPNAGIDVQMGSVSHPTLTGRAADFPIKPGAAPLRDPFESKTDWPDAAGPCTANNLSLPPGRHTLSPGIYCGGIRGGPGTHITLNPGVYVIPSGELRLVSSAQLYGRGVSIFLAGPNASITTKDTVGLDLTPPETGPMAGILIAHPPAVTPNRRTQELGGRGRWRLSGIIYMPRVYLRITAQMDENHIPANLIFITERISFIYGQGTTVTNLVANGEAGYITTAARLTK